VFKCVEYRTQVVAAFGGQEDVFKTLLTAKSDATCPPWHMDLFESLEHIETFKTPSVTLFDWPFAQGKFYNSNWHNHKHGGEAERSLGCTVMHHVVCKCM